MIGFHKFPIVLLLNCFYSRHLFKLFCIKLLTLMLKFKFRINKKWKKFGTSLCINVNWWVFYIIQQMKTITLRKMFFSQTASINIRGHSAEICNIDNFIVPNQLDYRRVSYILVEANVFKKQNHLLHATFCREYHSDLVGAPTISHNFQNSIFRCLVFFPNSADYLSHSCDSLLFWNCTVFRRKVSKLLENKLRWTLSVTFCNFIVLWL